MKIVEKDIWEGLRGFTEDEQHGNVDPDTLEHVVEQFDTPMIGAYNWDYTLADNRLKRLYELGKELNWNASLDIDWSTPRLKITEYPVHESGLNLKGYAPYDKLPESKQIELAWHMQAQTLSNIVHGEQGALLVASQLACSAPTYNAKLYAASQTFDEARHVEVFLRYLKERIGFMYGVQTGLKSLLDKILTDDRWDLKFIGMQIIIEGLALAAFASAQRNTRDPLLEQIMHYVIRDEARHVTFGVNYLQEYIATLSEKERNDRAEFAFEACVVMRDRMLPVQALQHWKFDINETLEFMRTSSPSTRFRQLLFTRVMPNLKRVGLITDSVSEKYEKLGILDFQDLEDDFEIDWADMQLTYDNTLSEARSEKQAKVAAKQSS